MTQRLRFRERRTAVEIVQPPSALAMRLALAHYIERCVEDGTLASYSDAANRLGISRPRLTQVAGFLLLRPQVQSDILLPHQSADSGTQDDHSGPN
ncbi:MAG: hypothetical protein V3W41_00620 [Planctomycetota bacterium]